MINAGEELQHDAVAAYEEDTASHAVSDATSTRRSVADDVNEELRARAVQDALDERFSELLKKCLGEVLGRNPSGGVVVVVAAGAPASFWDADVLESWKICGLW